MVNSGGTILSGAHVRSSAKGGSVTRGRARALLLSSALATVLAGVIQPGTADAACSGAGFPNVTVDCTGTDNNGFSSNNIFGSTTVNAGAGVIVQTAPSGTALNVGALTSITSNNTAATFTGDENGIVYTSGTSITLNNFSGSATGTTGNGIQLFATTGNITANNFTGTATGGDNGISATAAIGNITMTGFAGTATGTAPRRAATASTSRPPWATSPSPPRPPPSSAAARTA